MEVVVEGVVELVVVVVVVDIVVVSVVVMEMMSLVARMISVRSMCVLLSSSVWRWCRTACGSVMQVTVMSPVSFSSGQAELELGAISRAETPESR